MLSNNSVKTVYTVEDLPDEVLEFILSLTPPYKDLHDCMLVSKRWRRCVMNVVKTKRRNLYKAITEFDVQWQSITPVAMAPTIQKRYSHSAAVYDNSMYVFGGCTCAMTTFNDLWRLDLSKRQWVRPLTMGTYPSPKACSTMVCYKDNLVLFGGWTYPSSYPLHQGWHLFNELHIYNITANRWTCVNTTNTPPAIAGHSVSVHGNWMVIFGGLQKSSNVVHSMKSNDIWKLNLDTLTWYKQETKGHVKPVERYGQSQTILDDENVLIMGGCGGPSNLYNDVWVLNMKGELWTWIPVQVKNSSDAPANLWCNPVCRVGDFIVGLSRSRQSSVPLITYYSKGVWTPPREDVEPEQRREGQRRIDLAGRKVDKDENINGRRGTLKAQKREADDTPSDCHNKHQEKEAANDKFVMERQQPECSADAAKRELNKFDSLVLHRLPGSIMDMEPSTSRGLMEGSGGALSLSAFNGPQKTSLSSTTKSEKRLESLRKIEERLKREAANKNAGGGGGAGAAGPSSREDVVLQDNNNKPQNSSSNNQNPSPQHVQAAALRSAAATAATSAAAHSNPSFPSPKKQKRNVLGMYVLDISDALHRDKPCVQWLPLKNDGLMCQGPEETVLYSLVEGKGELIMFGGIQKDANSLASTTNLSNQVSNSLHFITAPKDVI